MSGIKVAFLDRDGVINKEVNYLHRIKDFEYTSNCKEALLNLIYKGFKIVIVTNQAGIAKGIFKEADYLNLTRWLRQDLNNSGIEISNIFYCPHHIEGILTDYAYDCECRKPKTGLLEKANQQFIIDLNKSILVGDKLSDIEAGQNFGLTNLFLVRSGHEINYQVPKGVVILDNLYSVSQYI